MKIVFCGDVCVCDSAELFRQKKANELFNDTIGVFKSADRSIVNLECALTERGTAIKKLGPNIKSPLETADVLKAVGVTDCALSNNHVFDLGIEGLNDTIGALERVGLGYTGIGDNANLARENMVIEYGNKKITIIDVCEHEYSYALEDRVGAREFDPFETADDIAKAKEESDFVVLIYHGGKEHCEYPSERLVRLCRSMVRRGADLVMCQHTHCIGCYEQFEGGHILYGQGNFHFVWKELSKIKPAWNQGLMVRAEFTDKCNVELIPTVVDGLGIRLANPEEKAKILSGIKERSKSLLDGSYKKGFAEFCKTQPQYTFVEEYIPQDKMERFRHFLDCEAHTDVWKEIYKTYNATNEK